MSFEQDPRFVVTLKWQYPGTPKLSELGIDLEERGYVRLRELENRFPEVEIWKRCGT